MSLQDLVISFTHPEQACYVPFHALDSVTVGGDGRAEVRTKAGYTFRLNEKQAARLKQLLDATSILIEEK